jgi:hypothetical protein
VHWFLLLVLSAVGCATSRPDAVPLPAVVSSSPSPERWARAACLRGAYPVELDDRAYARARHADLQAEWQGLPRPDATRKLIEERSAFEARCAAWLTAARLQSPSSSASFPGMITVGFDAPR